MAGVPNFNIRINGVQTAINQIKNSIVQDEVKRRLRKAHRRYRVKVTLIVIWWLLSAALVAVVVLGYLTPMYLVTAAVWVIWGLLWLWLARSTLKDAYRLAGQSFGREKGKGNGRYRRTAQAHRTGTAGSTGAGSRPRGGAGVSNESDFAGLEFAPGEVFGSRSFKVDQLGRLTGIAYETVWRPGENTAECKMTTSLYEVRSYYPSLYEKLTGEKVTLVTPPSSGSLASIYPSYSYIHPQTVQQPPVTERDMRRVCDIEHNMSKCGHGFYGYYEGSNDYGDQGQVNGVIRGWGETLIGTRGFRCGKAEIVALHIKNSTDKHLVERIHRNYPDVPFFDDYKRMIAEFPPDPGANALKGPDSPEFWELEL